MVGICFTVAFVKVPRAVAFGLLLMTAVVCAGYEDVGYMVACVWRMGVCVDVVSVLMVCLYRWSLRVCICLYGRFVCGEGCVWRDVCVCLWCGCLWCWWCLW